MMDRRSRNVTMGGKTRGRRRGFSLMELMIAIMILGIGLVMVATVFPIGVEQIAQTLKTNIAESAAESAIGVLQVKVPGRAVNVPGVTPNMPMSLAVNVPGTDFDTDLSASDLEVMSTLWWNPGSVYPYEGTMDDTNIYTFFAQGKFAIMMSGEGSARSLRRDFPDFEGFRIVPMPVPDGGKTGDMPNTPGQGHHFISSQAEHPDEAWLWIEWLSSKEYHQRMVRSGNGFSIFADLNTSENITDPYEAQIYAARAAHGVFGPFPPARNPDTAMVQPEAVVPDIGDLLIGIYTGQVEDWRQALIEEGPSTLF